MYHIRQEELFSFEQLMEMSPECKYTAILDPLPVAPLLHAISKKNNRGRQGDLNYRAMIYSLVIGKLERMEFVKDIIRRLKGSEEFRRLCRFTGSDRIPSEASYSRLIGKLHDLGVLSAVRDDLVLQSISEGFIQGEMIAVDASHVEAWDCSPAKKEASKKAPRSRQHAKRQPEQEEFELGKAIESEQSQSKPVNPKSKYKRGRPGAAEAEARRQEREAYEASLPIFEQKVAAMLPYSYEELLAAMPRTPSNGAKKDSKGRPFYWYGFKANLLVDTASQ